MNIRLGNVHDIPQLRWLGEAGAFDHYALDDEYDVEGMCDRLEEEMEDGLGGCILAIEQGNILGVLTWSLEVYEHDNDHQIMVENHWAMVEGKQASLAGLKLLKAFIALADEHGFRTQVCLGEQSPSNALAILLNYGYHVVEYTLERDPDDGEEG